MAVQPALEEALDATHADTILLADIGLLFLPDLRLDPLVLLTRLSAHARLVVAWPGSYDSHNLAYAVPEHGHYRSWPAPDTLIINL